MTTYHHIIRLWLQDVIPALLLIGALVRAIVCQGVPIRRVLIGNEHNNGIQVVSWVLKKNGECGSEERRAVLAMAKLVLPLFFPAHVAHLALFLDSTQLCNCFGPL